MARNRPIARGRFWRWLVCVLLLWNGSYPVLQVHANELQAEPHSLDPAVVLKDTILPTETDVGALAGSFSVSQDGSSQYTIPLWVPAGREGIQPELSLSYSSAGGDGFFGVGWNLSGFSQITRCPLTFAEDGEPAPIRWEFPADALCLNGARLALIAGEHGQVDVEYRTVPESFSRVRILETDELGPTVIREEKKDGRIFTYGSSIVATARIEGLRVVWQAGLWNEEEPTSAYVPARYGWALSLIEDRSGNTLEITYTQEDQTQPGVAQELLPLEIRYTGHHSGVEPLRAVQFRYKERTAESRRVSYVAGFAFQQTRLIEQIDLLAPPPALQAPSPDQRSIVRAYRFMYEISPLTERELLQSVQECDGDPIAPTPPLLVTCLPPTSFSWEDGSAEFAEVITDIGDVALPGFEWYWSLLPADVNGDGRDDILYRNGSRWTYRLSQVDSSGQVALGPATELNIADDISRDAVEIVPVDLNMDRLIDLAAIERGADLNGDIYNYYQNMGGSFAVVAPTASTVAPAQVEEETEVGRPILIMDFMGDAMPEILRPLETGHWGLRDVEVNEAGDIEDITPPEPLEEMTFDQWCSEPPPPALTGSEEGEESDLADLLMEEEEGGEFAADEVSALEEECTPRRTAWNTYMADIDGDGRPDLLARDPKELADDSVVPQGSRLFAINGSALDEGQPTTLLVSRPVSLTRRYFFSDFNSDGLDDALRLTEGEPAPSLILNTGADGYFAPAQPQDQLSASDNQFNIRIGTWWRDSNDPGIRFLDFNLDGRQDILLVDNGVIRDSNGELVPTRSNLVVLVSTNAGLQPRELAIPVGDPANGRDALPPPLSNYNLSQVLDLNGDGLTDLVQMVQGQVRLYVRQGQRPDVLIAVKDGMGMQLAIDYKPLVDPSVYTPVSPEACLHRELGRQSHQLCAVRGPWVVSEYRIDNGIGRQQNRYSFQYKDARVDRKGLGWLGLGERVITDMQRNTTIAETFDNKTVNTFHGLRTYPFLGLKISEDQVTQFESIIHILSRTINRSFSYEFVKIHGEKTYYVRPDEVRESESELPASGPSTLLRGLFYGFTYNPDEDVFGNTASSSTPYEIWHATYRNDPERWLIGLPTRIETISDGLDLDGQGTIMTRTVAYAWGLDSGLLDVEIVEPEGGVDQYLETHYEREDDGQVKVIRSLDLTGTAREMTIEYDAVDGVYPASTQNSLGHRTRTFIHPALGVVGAVDDPNSVRTVYQYDGFGRLRRVPLPGGGGRTLTYARALEPGTSVENEQFTLNMTTLYDGGEERVTLNRLGQEIRSERRNLDGSLSFVETQWNELGLVAAVTRPALVGQLPGVTIHSEYDELGRLRLQERPGDDDPWGGLRHLVIIYIGLQMNITDEVDNSMQVQMDQLGRTQWISNLMTLQGKIITEFTYGPFSQLSRVQRWSANKQEQTATGVHYDTLGRRTHLVDPDSGETQFFYNAFGDVVREVDANQDQTYYIPDELGRLKTQNDKDGTTAFLWDQGPNGIGQLSQTISPDGTRVLYDYDSFGRPERQIYEIQGTQYAMAQQYDVHGRLDTLTYPLKSDREFQIRHEYNPNSGELVRVKNVQTGSVYWELLARTAADQIERERFGNGLETTRTYFPVSGRLQRIRTQRTSLLATGAAMDDLNPSLSGEGESVSASVEAVPGPAAEPSELTEENPAVDSYFLPQVHQQAHPPVGEAESRDENALLLPFVQQQSPAVTALSALTDTLQALSYAYYADGNLRLRRDEQRAQFESFFYDELNRLVTWFETDANGEVGPDPGRWRVDYAYSDLGNLTARTFTPGAQGGSAQQLGFEYNRTGNAGPHAVTLPPWGEYSYDKRGNQTERPEGESITYTAFDLPRQITGPTAASFQYDSFGTRVLKEQSSTQKTVYVGGLYEKRTTATQIDHVFYIMGAERTVAQVTQVEIQGQVQPEQTLYLHDDRLGSVETISNEQGDQVRTIKHDPYGNPVDNFNQPVLPDLGRRPPSESGVTLGFTEHEHDDELGLINMRGRMYDPRLGRFLTPDPFIQGLFDGQAYNRYSYVLNNPLRFTDPSGFVNCSESSEESTNAEDCAKPKTWEEECMADPVCAEALSQAETITVIQDLDPEDLDPCANMFDCVPISGGGDTRGGGGRNLLKPDIPKHGSNSTGSTDPNGNTDPNGQGTNQPPQTTDTYAKVNTPLPRSGPGFKAYKPTATQYGTPKTVGFIQKLGALWNKLFPNGPNLLIGDLSKQGGGLTPKGPTPKWGYHKGHQEGREFDVQIIRKDDEELVRKTNVGDENYSYERTQQLVDVIHSLGGPSVVRILWPTQT